MKIAQAHVGSANPFFLIAGPCVIESETFALDTAGEIRHICDNLSIPFVYKSSYDKANRTSIDSYRGLGMTEGLEILRKVKTTVDVPVLTDVHSPDEACTAADYVDVIQTPAFLCRQTDLIQAAAATGKLVNIKKAQFLSPHEMKHVVDKAERAGGKGNILVCERGSSYGYNNLVVDMRSLTIMRETGCPVVFDATHSVQLPGGRNGASGGQREFVPTLARAAVGVGIDGLFVETHPDPDQAPSDGPNAVPLNRLADLLEGLKEIDFVVKNRIEQF
ncbi:MAG: 3-deoxy-8-phosphooctulonate synthase [Acidiferrobacterales bacterium]|nr:3-deoxy-8-phosphooctulonate synthase [Acidiferrobacterales bacterium]